MKTQKIQKTPYIIQTVATNQTTYTWKEINIALTKQGIAPKYILDILKKLQTKTN
tara:strand:- start:54 stop:218 length:165 start_codon:yes stop_codon:yes gene_type:complete